MLRCTKCILPETFPNIKFDKKGVCNYCLTHHPIRYKGEPALRKLLNSHRNEGRKYDCIVGVSGGRDSSFVLYNIKEKYKMRVLAYNYENCFTTEEAKENLQNMIDALNVDFVQIVSQTQKKCLRNHIIAWARKPSSEPFPQLCYGCSMGAHGGAYKISREMKIPLLITGRSQTEKSIFKNVLRWELPTRWLNCKKQLFPLHLLVKALKNPFYLNPRNFYYYLLANIEFPLKGWRVGGDEAVMGLKSDRYVTLVPFFDFIEHNKEDVSTIVDKLGWKKSSRLSSSWRFDCQVHALKTYIFWRKLGFSENDEMLSIMIRNKILSRSEALMRIEQEKHNINTLLSIMEEVFDKINLPRKYRERIIYC